MKLIIAGGRDITDFQVLIKALAFHNINASMVEEVVCGEASGADALGKIWAENHNIPVKSFPADWKNINVPGAVVKTSYTSYGKNVYNAKAGIDRNAKMAKYADTLLAIWDGESRGTENMIDTMQSLGKETLVYEV